MGSCIGIARFLPFLVEPKFFSEVLSASLLLTESLGLSLNILASGMEMFLDWELSEV